MTSLHCTFSAMSGQILTTALAFLADQHGRNFHGPKSKTFDWAKPEERPDEVSGKRLVSLLEYAKGRTYFQLEEALKTEVQPL